MSISDEDREIIQQELYYSIVLNNETQNSEEFRDVASVRRNIDTEIWHTGQLKDNIRNRTESDLLDNIIL